MEETQKKGSTNTAAYLLTTFCVGIISAVSIYVYQLHVKITKLEYAISSNNESSIHTLQQSILDIKQDYKDLSSSINAVQSNIDKQIASFDKALSNNESSIISTLMKISHGIDIAQWTISFTQDQNATIKILSLLEKDAELISQYKNQIRASLALDIAKVQNYQLVDTLGLVARIEAIKKDIQDLNIYSRKLEKVKQELPPLPESGFQRYSEMLKRLYNHLIRFKRHDNIPASLLTTEGRLILIENINIILSQLQISVLHNDANIYNSLINEVKNLIQQNFTDNEINRKILNAISALENEIFDKNDIMLQSKQVIESIIKQMDI